MNTSLNTKAVKYLALVAIAVTLRHADAFAAELTVNNCDGTLLSSTQVDEGSNAKVIVITDEGKASSVKLQQAGTNALSPATADLSVANFLDIHEGVWSACASDSNTVLSAEIKKDTSKGTLALWGAGGAAGIGGIVALATSGGGGSGGSNDVGVTGGSASTQAVAPVAAQPASPVRDVVSAKPIETVSNTPDCTGIKTLAASTGCRNTEDTDPLSPYK